MPRAASGRWALALLAVAAPGACGDLGFTSEVIGKRPFTPPAAYRAWWAGTETCAARTAPFERVQWYLAAGIAGDGRVGRARWSPPHDIILVTGYETDSVVVRHEILHDLLEGDRLHERVEWAACGLTERVVD